MIKIERMKIEKKLKFIQKSLIFRSYYKTYALHIFIC